MLSASKTILTGATAFLLFESSVGAVVPTKVEKRVPQTNSWPSTNTFTFSCHSLTLPQFGGAQGVGEGGVGIFTKDGPVMTAPDGSTIYPTDCETTGLGYEGCRFDSGWLIEPITDAQVTYNAAGGSCYMRFNYLNVDYDTSNGGSCGVSDAGFEAFSSDMTALCYIEACAEGSGCGVPDGGYQGGQCGVHVVQHQKPDPAVDPYTLDISIKDAYGRDVGDSAGNAVDANTFVVIGESDLPYDLQVGVLNVDDDPLQFWYAGAFWDSNSDQCSVGGYDSGSRQMDCGFGC